MKATSLLPPPHPSPPSPYIYSVESSSITDEDIDTLLRKGEEKTKEGAEKLKTDMSRSLNSMGSLDFSGKYDESVLMWGDSTDVAAADAGAFMGDIVPLGQRERRKVDGSGVDGDKKAPPPVSKQGTGTSRLAVRAPVMTDYMFFDRKRIEQLVARENEVIAQKRVLANTVKVRGGRGRRG